MKSYSLKEDTVSIYQYTDDDYHRNMFSPSSDDLVSAMTEGSEEAQLERIIDISLDDIVIHPKNDRWRYFMDRAYKFVLEQRNEADWMVAIGIIVKSLLALIDLGEYEEIDLDRVVYVISMLRELDSEKFLFQPNVSFKVGEGEVRNLFQAFKDMHLEGEYLSWTTV